MTTPDRAALLERLVLLMARENVLSCGRSPKCPWLDHKEPLCEKCEAKALLAAALALLRAEPAQGEKKCIECQQPMTDLRYDMCESCEEAFHKAEEASTAPAQPTLRDA